MGYRKWIFIECYNVPDTVLNCKDFLQGLWKLKSSEVNFSKVLQRVMVVLSFRNLRLPGSKGKGSFNIG